MQLKLLKLLKIVFITVICMITFCFNGMIVSAETVQDGISVTVSTDKEEYKSNEEVKLIIKLKNSNDFELSNIKIENVLPKGISLVSGDVLKDNISLQANEECTINLSVKKSSIDIGSSTNNVANGNNGNNSNHSSSTSQSVNDTSTNQINGSPNLGENNIVLIVLIIMLIAIIIITICCMKDKKKYSKFLSILMCIGVLNVFGITGVIYATSENNQKSFTYEYTYKIDNVDYIHKIIISYNLKNNNVDNNNNNDNITEKELKENITKNAESTLKCMINSDYSEGFYYTSMYGEIKNELAMSELAKTIMSKMKYKFNDITVKEDFAIIQSEFENVDMQEILYQVSDMEYNEQNNQLVLNKLKNNNFETKTFNLELIMLKKDNIWYLYETPDFNDAITGGLYLLYTDMENAFLDEITKGEN